jgi:predicted dehydrogenase
MGLTIGMIGLRHPHSAGHLRTLAAAPEVEAVVVCDEAAEARAAAGQHCPKIAATVADPAAVLGHPAVDVVIVTLPTDATPAAVTAAARAGKHVLCEKPGARTAAEFEPALTALAEAGRSFGVYYTWRRMPPILRLRDLVRQGALGRLLSVEMRMVTTQVALRDPTHWLFKAVVSGGGIVSWLGCHWLDVTRFVTGEEWAEVSTLAGTLSGEAIDVEDVATVGFRLTGGAIGSLHAGYLIAGGRAGYEGATNDIAFRLRGTLGRADFLWAPRGEQSVVLHSEAPGWETATHHTFTTATAEAPAYGNLPGLAFVREFLAAAEQGRAGPATAIDALRVLEILDAVYTSARERRVVEVARRPAAPPAT